MSRGLRYLIDRNSYHVVVCTHLELFKNNHSLIRLQDTTNNGYFPPTGTLVMIALSIALTYVSPVSYVLYRKPDILARDMNRPAFAYAQHRFFKGPFCPVHDDDIESLHASNEFPADEEPKPSGEETLSSSPNSSPVSALSQSMPLLKDCCSIPAATEKVRTTEGDAIANDS